MYLVKWYSTPVVWLCNLHHSDIYSILLSKILDDLYYICLGPYKLFFRFSLNSNSFIAIGERQYITESYIKTKVRYYFHECDNIQISYDYYDYNLPSLQPEHPVVRLIRPVVCSLETLNMERLDVCNKNIHT